MRICDLSSGVGALTHAFALLKERWEEARLSWHDEAGRQFEQTHLKPLPVEMQRLLGAVQRLSEVLVEAEQELGDRPDEGS